MKIGLFLMTKKGFSVLNYLIDSSHTDSIDFVCIGRDSNVEDDYSEKIKNLCIASKVIFFFKDSFMCQKVNSDYYITISWRWIIDLPNLIVIHDSVLPKYRGFAPLVNMLINGEKEIGVTALFANKEYDSGAIIAQEKMSVNYPIKIADAIDQISSLYGNIVSQILQNIKNNSVELVGQDDTKATYSLWLDEDDYFINWDWPAEKIKRKIDACGVPYSGAKSRIGKDIIIITEASVESDVQIENRSVGKVVFLKNNYPVIVCGSGLLKIREAHNENTKESFLPLTKFRIKFN